MSRIKSNILLWVFSAIAIYSCTENKKAATIPHFSEKDFTYAQNLSRSEGRLYKEAIAYIDSVYNTFPSISIADKYKYYLFRCQLVDPGLQREADLQRALLYTDSMLSLIEKNDLQEQMTNEYATAFRLKGELCMNLGKYNDAFKAVSMCKFLSFKGGDSCNAGSNTATLGLIAYQQKKYLQAAALLKESLGFLNCCKNGEDRFYQLQGQLDNLALSYAKAGQYDSAVKYYGQAESYVIHNKALFKSNPVFPYEALTVIYGNFADVMRLKKEYDSSIYYIKKIIKLNELYFTNNPVAAIQPTLALVDLHFDKGNFSEGYRLLNKEKASIFTFDETTQLHWLSLMSIAANKTGNVTDELKYTKLLYAKRDSVAAKSIATSNTDPTLEFEKIQKTHELNILRKDNEIQKTYIIASVFIVVLFLSLALVIFLNLKRTRKLNAELLNREQKLKQLNKEQEIAKEKEKKDELLLQGMRLQMEYNDAIVAQRRKISNDMHDELSSSLAALKFYVEDVKGKVKDPDSKEVLNDINEEVASVYENARRYMHNLQSNTGETHYDLISFLTDISTDFSEKKLLSINLDIDNEKIKTILNSFQHDHLYHIIREAIANIIKHAHASEINIKIDFTETSCRFIVTDNGKGFDELKINNGIGLNSIRTRIKELQGSITINSTKDGTVLNGAFRVF